MKYWLIRFIDITSKAVIAGFIALVLLIAIVVSLTRYYLPLIENFHHDIITIINDNTDVFDVQAERITAKVDGLIPEIELYKVKVITRKQDEVIFIDELSLSLDPIKSLQRLRPHFEKLRVSNLDLLVVQSQKKLWGLKTTATKSTSEPLKVRSVVDQLWSIDNLEIENVRVTLDAYDHPPRRLPTASLRVVTSGEKKKLGITVVDPDDENKLLLDFFSEASSYPYDANFKVNANMVLNQVNVVNYLPLLSSQYGFHSGVVTSELELSFKDNELFSQGNIDIGEFDFSPVDTELPVRFDGLAGEFRLRLNEGIQTLSFADFNLHKENQTLHIPKIKFGRSEKMPELFQAYVAQLDLQILSSQIKGFLEADKFSKLIDYIDGLSLSGHLRHLFFSTPFEDLKAFRLTANADQVSAEFFKNIPAFSNASGVLEVAPLDGVFFIDSQDFSLHLKQVFDQGFSVAKADGRLIWSINPASEDNDQVPRLLLEGKGLDLMGDIGHASGDFALDTPMKRFEQDSEFDPPRLSLSIGVENSKVSYVPRFVPHFLSKNLRSWLGDNLLGGDIARVDYIFQGVTSKYAKASRVNQLSASFNNGELKYLEAWPTVGQLKGQITLDDKDINVTADKAQLLGVDISNIEASVRKNRKGQAEVSVIADYRSGLDQAIELLNIEPIAKPINYQMDDWVLSASAKTQKDIASGSIKILVPLTKGIKPEVDLYADLGGLNLSHRQLNLDLENIKGRLKYSLDKGIQAERLSYQLLGRPFISSIQSKKKSGSKQAGEESGLETKIFFNGGLAITTINQYLDQVLLTQFDGVLPAKGHVYLSSEGSGIHLESDLTGLEIQMPQPFGKQKDEAKSLRLDFPFSAPSGKDHLITANYGGFANIQFRLNDFKLDAGRVYLGIRHAPFKKNKILIGGQLSELNVEQWVDFLERYQIKSKSYKVQARSLSREEMLPAQSGINRQGDAVLIPELHQQSSSQQATSWAIQVEGLNVRKFDAYGYLFNRARLSLFDRTAYWRFDIEHDDIKAKLRVPVDDKPYNVDVQYLDLSFLSTEDEELEAQSLVASIDQGTEQKSEKKSDQNQSGEVGEVEAAEDTVAGEISSLPDKPAQVDSSTTVETLDEVISVLSSPEVAGLPDMKVQVHQLMYGEQHFGEWEFVFSSDESSVFLTDLRGQLRNMQIGSSEDEAAVLSWELLNDERQSKGEGVSTYLTTRIYGENMADVLSAWGYGQEIVSKDFSFDIDVDWEGSPTDYNFEALNGSIRGSLNKGSFADMESSSAGALKLVSALSLSNLLRRLKLDFTDLTDQGLSYDKVRGRVYLDEGLVSFDQKPIEIKGSSSRIALLGKADMNNEEMDVELSVTLPLASNLPWVAALAAGLPTAAGVYIISKLLKTQVDKLSSALYSVKGSFEDPEVKFVRLFDNN